MPKELEGESVLGMEKPQEEAIRGKNQELVVIIKPDLKVGKCPCKEDCQKLVFTSRKDDTARVRLGELEFNGNENITIDVLKEKKIISHKVKNVKVFLSGEIKNKINLKGINVTRGARKVIEDLGGKIT